MHLRKRLTFFSFSVFVTTACGQWQQADQTNEEINPSKRPETTEAGNTNPTPQPDTPIQPTPKISTSTEIPKPSSTKLIEPFGTILSETNSENDFVDWALAAENRNELEKVGYLDETQRSLTLKTDVTLSFSRFAQTSLFKINTQGFRIMLIGSDFGYLEIQTQKANQDSGEVVIYSTGQNLPRVDTSGSSGINGNDGVCPTQINCIPVTDQITTRKTPTPQIQWQSDKQKLVIDWNDQSLTSNIREAIRTAVITENTETLRAQCPNDIFFLQTEGPDIRGRVILTREVLHPKMNDGFALTQSADATLLEGSSGQSGFNSGSITIFHLGEGDKNWLKFFKTAGGSGGMGGLNLKTPRSSGRDKVDFKSIIISEEIETSNLSAAWRIQCLANRGRALWTQNSTLAGRWAYPMMNIQSGLGFTSSQITLPAIQEGRDDLSGAAERAAPGAPGHDGKIEFQKAKTWEDWRAVVHPKIPIPKKCLNH